MKSSKINSGNQKLNEYDVTIDTGQMCQMFSNMILPTSSSENSLMTSANLLFPDTMAVSIGSWFEKLQISREAPRNNRILAQSSWNVSTLFTYQIVQLFETISMWLFIFHNFSEVLFSGKIPCHEPNTITLSMLENKFQGILENLNENKQDIHTGSDWLAEPAREI